MTRQTDERQLCLFGEPVFSVDTWESEGQWFVQLHGVDVVAFAHDLDEAAQKAGAMVEDLFVFLAEQPDRTPAETETAEFIAQRLAPAVTRYHAAQRRAALAERIRAAFAKSVDWRVGQPSTPHGSVPVLTG